MEVATTTASAAASAARAAFTHGFLALLGTLEHRLQPLASTLASTLVVSKPDERLVLLSVDFVALAIALPLCLSRLRLNVPPVEAEGHAMHAPLTNGTLMAPLRPLSAKDGATAAPMRQAASDRESRSPTAPAVTNAGMRDPEAVAAAAAASPPAPVAEAKAKVTAKEPATGSASVPPNEIVLDPTFAPFSVPLLASPEPLPPPKRLPAEDGQAEQPTARPTPPGPSPPRLSPAGNTTRRAFPKLPSPTGEAPAALGPHVGSPRRSPARPPSPRKSLASSSRAADCTDSCAEPSAEHLLSPSNWLARLSDERRAIEKAWERALSEEQFRVLRMGATEPIHSGAYNDHFERGVYEYTAAHKFKSGHGWPAFADNLPGALIRKGTRKIEIVCASCEGHIGHIFKSSRYPPPKRERHCVNSVCLKFKPAADATSSS